MYVENRKESLDKLLQLIQSIYKSLLNFYRSVTNKNKKF